MGSARVRNRIMMPRRGMWFTYYNSDEDERHEVYIRDAENGQVVYDFDGERNRMSVENWVRFVCDNRVDLDEWEL